MSQLNVINNMNHTPNGELPMIVFSDSRKVAIKEMKKFIKLNYDDLYHHHFILYSALRGQDVRKTSHLSDGMNAIDGLITLKSRVESYKKGTSFFFRKMVNDEGEPIFDSEDATWLADILEEAKTIVNLTAEANDGLNTLQLSQPR